jgi:hypothetical protein
MNALFRIPIVLAAALLGAGLTESARAQQPLLSPRDSVQIRFNGKRIFIDYGRPSMRGRVIMGGLVPHNRWWRTGANEATSFVTDADLRIGDTVVPRGAYTLYTLPSAKQWKLMVNKQTGQWGTVYDPALDLVRIPLKKRSLRQPIEKFTILLERTGTRTGTLRLRWERIDLWLPFTVLSNGAAPQR